VVAGFARIRRLPNFTAWDPNSCESSYIRQRLCNPPGANDDPRSSSIHKSSGNCHSRFRPSESTIPPPAFGREPWRTGIGGRSKFSVCRSESKGRLADNEARPLPFYWWLRTHFLATRNSQLATRNSFPPYPPCLEFSASRIKREALERQPPR